MHRPPHQGKVPKLPAYAVTIATMKYKHQRLPYLKDFHGQEELARHHHYSSAQLTTNIEAVGTEDTRTRPTHTRRTDPLKCPLSDDSRGTRPVQTLLLRVVGR